MSTISTWVSYGKLQIQALVSLFEFCLSTSSWQGEMAKVPLFTVLCVLFSCTAGNPIHSPHTGKVSNGQSSLTFVFQNNLNASDDQNHVGAILLEPSAPPGGGAGCQAIGESLITQATIQNYSSDFSEALAYLNFKYGIGPSFQIDNSVLSVTGKGCSFAAQSHHKRLPLLCTQSSNANLPPNSTATPANEVTVATKDNSFLGFRNQKSFRFLGIRYADQPARFTYSQLSTQKGQTINATAYGSICVQPYQTSGSEDCLFLNIQTPYLPKQGSSKNLRPVLFWIHGGGFTGGTGNDPQTDGGNLASREDIVVVTFNYRLSTLGFLAIPGTDIKGNFGIGDQIIALKWTIANIASFGGDPKRITIMGDSAGAGSVRALLGSPPAIGLYQGAIAMSNLGGGEDLGLDSNYGTTYSSYLTIAESYNISGLPTINGTNCTRSSLAASIACLKTANATEMVNLPAPARYVVQDGTIVTTPELTLTPNPGTAHVPVIFGTTTNDGASFSTYVANATNLTYALEQGLGITTYWANQIIDSGLFPFYDTGNFTHDAFNVTQRVATDNTFRCIDQATVYAGAITHTFPAAYYYDFAREVNGYDPNGLGGPPVTPGYPNGNPNLPYFRLHSGDLPWVFGNFFVPLRDDADLWSTQLVSSYWGAFIKTGQPNPDIRELAVRGRSYERTVEAVRSTGMWEAVRGREGPIKELDWPARTRGFIDVVQCQWLNYSLSYYVD
jgi:carboxylesterase type B